MAPAGMVTVVRVPSALIPSISRVPSASSRSAFAIGRRRWPRRLGMPRLRPGQWQSALTARPADLAGPRLGRPAHGRLTGRRHRSHVFSLIVGVDEVRHAGFGIADGDHAKGGARHHDAGDSVERHLTSRSSARVTIEQRTRPPHDAVAIREGLDDLGRRLGRIGASFTGAPTSTDASANASTVSCPRGSATVCPVGADNWTAPDGAVERQLSSSGRRATASRDRCETVWCAWLVVPLRASSTGRSGSFGQCHRCPEALRH